MQFCLIYEDQEGACKIIVPKGPKWASWASEEEAIHRLHSFSIPDCVEFIACRSELIPKDRTFRDAWKKGISPEPIIIDFQKAIDIHRFRIKTACERKIDQLTKQMAIAFEKSNLPEAVAIGRTTQILRTIPEEMNLSHCKSVEDIKYAIPRELFDVWDFYPPERV